MFGRSLCSVAHTALQKNRGYGCPRMVEVPHAGISQSSPEPPSTRTSDREFEGD